jgi:hypothetical protein
MICYSVFECTTYDGIPLIAGKGIGLDGTLATLADPKYFPLPKLHPLQVVSFQPPSATSLIMNADFFQFHDKINPYTRYDSIIIKEQVASEDALVWWVITIQGINEFYGSTTVGGVHVIEDTAARYPGYWQGLFRMEPNASVVTNGRFANITLSWNGTDLNLEKKMK